MASNYKKDFDYAEAIAGTQDAGERQQLLAERQNKIEAEGLAGKVASNDAVSTWNGNYRPYSVSSTESGGNEVSQLYDAAEQARLQRLEAARTRIQQQLQRNLSSIESDYTASMTQTDINARQSVISNEEKLAALGLNMGARGAAATSGTAETNIAATLTRSVRLASPHAQLHRTAPLHSRPLWRTSFSLPRKTLHSSRPNPR